MFLSIDSVNKTYRIGQKKALANFSVDLTPGVYGFLGPNGAGKTTLMNIITDNLSADSGQVLYNGKSIQELGADFRAVLGYMPQHQGVYNDFTANRFLWYMSALKGLRKKEAKDKIEEVLELVNLRADAHKKLGSFSGGMKQRILIAQALLNNPEILILDEPTAGLDPKERIRIRNFISSIAQNKIVLLATHVVSDVECIAKEVILVKNGELLRKAPTSQLIEEINGSVWETEIGAEQVAEYSEKYLVSNLLAAEDGRITVRVILKEKSAEAGYRLVHPTLEDVYLYHFSDDESMAVHP